MVNKQERFLGKAYTVHGGKYDYSKVKYINASTKICIICPEHGEFWQTPMAHLRGQGCPKCGKKKQGRHYTCDMYKERAMKVHGGKYDYSKALADDSLAHNCIICPEHGEFWQSWNSHINNKQGCPKCHGHGRTLEEVKHDLSVADGGKYICLETSLKKMRYKWKFLCPDHGVFYQSATKHLAGQRCPECMGVKKHTEESFSTSAKKIHGDKYDYSKVAYTNNKENVCIICPIHGEFWQTPFNHLHGHGCPKCVDTTSSNENEIADFLNSIGKIQYERNNRELISPYEIDLYFQKERIAIEHDGIRWHSEKYEENESYHLMKTILCEEKGVQLIHIFEDEWVYKREIAESRLRNIFGITPNRIHARKCEIKEVSYKDSKMFLDKSHIQGNCVSKYRYGLYYENELVSLMTFGKPRKNLNGKQRDGIYEMLRFCNKLNTSVVGGASKLLKHFIDVMNPSEIISYSDRRWGSGGMYERLGFTLDHTTKPNYFYVVGNKRKNRFAYRKDVLVRKYGCPENVSEHEFMLSKGWYRIYDCGTKVWKIKL